MEFTEMEDIVRYHLVVGIDYGTTFSGVGFAMSDCKDISKVHMIQHWPTNTEESLATETKTPSQIAYTTENPKSNLVHNAWGYQITPRMSRYAWMKLLLDQNALPSLYDDPDLQEEIQKGVFVLPKEKSAQDVTSDYVRELYAFTMKSLMQVLFKGQEEALDITPIKFWFTMPAIWSDEAQAKTLAAARKAGFGTREGDEICMIKEPEAAAFATLKETAVDWDSSAKKEGGVLLVDCGGGTVDITAYTVSEVEPTLVLKEACVGIGAKCGATYIDRNLRRLMSRRFGEAFDSVKQVKIAQGTRFMTDFENNKRIYGVEGAELKPMRLFMEGASNSMYYYAEEGEVTLTDDDMRSIFDPVIDVVLKLVTNQFNSANNAGVSIKNLVLVGGFGKSPYLQNRLREWCRDNSVRMRIPENGWGAVVKGAVIRGLEIARVDEQRCRKWYGIQCGRLFKRGVDREEDAYFCPFTNKKWAMGYMAWHIKKGDEIFQHTTVKMGFYRILRPDERKLHIAIFSCSLDRAPDKYSENSVERVGRQIVGDLSGVDMSMFEKKIINGETQIKFNHIIEVVLGDRVGTILFRIKDKERSIGEASIEFSD